MARKVLLEIYGLIFIKAMRIGIDLQVLSQQPRTGVGNYAFHLTRALLDLKTEHEWVLFGAEDIIRFVQNDRRVEIVVLPDKNIPFWTAHVNYARIMQEAKLDILHCPANALPFFYQGRGVITIHDLAIYRHPEWFARGQFFSKRILVPQSIKKANAIIVPSEATKKDLIDLFGVGEEKVVVIPHGVEERFFRNSDLSFNSSPRLGREPDGKYILFVGTIEPRKNLGRLIEAYEGLPRETRDEYDLVIAGGRGWGGEDKKLKIKVQNLGPKSQSKITLLGYVPDQDLPALYQGASVFVYPSLYEGFGLPVLEAMAAGVPVVTSQGTAMEELSRASESAALVNPYSVESITSGILKIIRDEAYSSGISRVGTQTARQFSWERTAKASMKVYER